MQDDAAADGTAAERDAAEEASAFSHPPVDPDITAAYGDDPDQVIDFYVPREPDPAVLAPLVVVLHGGAWRAPYDRRHITPFADFLARRGFAVANVEYRRGGPAAKPESGPIPAQGGPGPVRGAGGPVAGRWPDTFDDIAAAFDALPALVRELLPQADARRMVVTGHSAGGQLALWAAARHLLPADAPWRTDRPAPCAASSPSPRSRTSRSRRSSTSAAEPPANSWAGKVSSRSACRTPTRRSSSPPGSPPLSSRAAPTSSSRRPSPSRTPTRPPRREKWSA